MAAMPEPQWLLVADELPSLSDQVRAPAQLAVRWFAGLLDQ